MASHGNKGQRKLLLLYIYIFHDYMSYLTVNCRSNKVLFFSPGLCRLKLLDPFFASHLGIKQTNKIHILPHQKKNKKIDEIWIVGS